MTSLNEEGHLAQLLRHGWEFKYEPETAFIGAYHADGGKMSICQLVGTKCARDAAGSEIARLISRLAYLEAAKVEGGAVASADRLSDKIDDVIREWRTPALRTGTKPSQATPPVDALVEALEKLEGDSLDAICEVIGAPKQYNDGKSAMRKWFLTRIDAALAAKPSQDAGEAVSREMQISGISLEVAKALVDQFGGDDTDMTLAFFTDAHSGPGFYSWCTEYPEDGSEYLGKASEWSPLPSGSALAAQPSQATPHVDPDEDDALTVAYMAGFERGKDAAKAATPPVDALVEAVKNIERAATRGIEEGSEREELYTIEARARTALAAAKAADTKRAEEPGEPVKAVPVSGEVVAWQSWNGDNPNLGVFTHRRPAFGYENSRPLYAHPSPDALRDEVKAQKAIGEALSKIEKEIAQRVDSQNDHLYEIHETLMRAYVPARSFPSAADGSELPEGAAELFAAGLAPDDARFVAGQLARDGFQIARLSDGARLWHSVQPINRSSIVGGGAMLLAESGECIGLVHVLNVAPEKRSEIEAAVSAALSRPATRGEA